MMNRLSSECLVSWDEQRVREGEKMKYLKVKVKHYHYDQLSYIIMILKL